MSAKLSNPTAAAQNWANKLGAAQQAYIDGVNAVTVAPGQLAANAKQLWLANTTASVNRFAANSAAVTKESWQNSTTTKGAPRLGQGATAAQPKVEAVFAKLFPAIAAVVNTLPARGDINANVARSAAFALAMNKKKGTFK